MGRCMHVCGFVDLPILYTCLMNCSRYMYANLAHASLLLLQSYACVCVFVDSHSAGWRRPRVQHYGRFEEEVHGNQ